MNHRVRAARYIYPSFSFTVFRMIMKQFRQGKDCGKRLDLLAYRSGARREGSMVQQVIAKPKIVGDRLIMRLETAYVVPSPGASQRYLVSRNLLDCPHTSKWTHENTTVSRLLHMRFATLERVLADHRTHIMNHRCTFCPTEFDISIKRFEGQGVVLFITKWLDLGNGLSPLESDLPLVVKLRQATRRAQSGEPLAYESPRDRYEELASRGALRAVPDLDDDERKELFGKSNSMLARLKRSRDPTSENIFAGGMYQPCHPAHLCGTMRRY